MRAEAASNVRSPDSCPPASARRTPPPSPRWGPTPGRVCGAPSAWTSARDHSPRSRSREGGTPCERASRSALWPGLPTRSGARPARLHRPPLGTSPDGGGGSAGPVLDAPFAAPRCPPARTPASAPRAAVGAATPPAAAAARRVHELRANERAGAAARTQSLRRRLLPLAAGSAPSPHPAASAVAVAAPSPVQCNHLTASKNRWGWGRGEGPARTGGGAATRRGRGCPTTTTTPPPPRPRTAAREERGRGEGTERPKKEV